MSLNKGRCHRQLKICLEMKREEMKWIVLFERRERSILWRITGSCRCTGGRWAGLCGRHSPTRPTRGRDCSSAATPCTSSPTSPATPPSQASPTWRPTPTWHPNTVPHPSLISSSFDLSPRFFHSLSVSCVSCLTTVKNNLQSCELYFKKYSNCSLYTLAKCLWGDHKQLDNLFCSK